VSTCLQDNDGENCFQAGTGSILSFVFNSDAMLGASDATEDERLHKHVGSDSEKSLFTSIRVG
jgi:hypothetical protein